MARARLTKLKRPHAWPLAWLLAALLSIWCVGMFGRGYWTPDEPREADIAWRMSWQPQKAVPLLAGEAFCEKPPLTYWLAALPISTFRMAAWSARLPNLLYAAITALCVGLLAARSLGRFAGVVAAAAIGSFMLSYQVLIWLATDAPLLAAESAALLGAYQGFYARRRRARLRGYLFMHAALAAGFLCKSAVAWMVPALAILTLSIWEKRWRELLRWELYAGLLLQAVVILTWVAFVYLGPGGAAHLKIFFWNNLAGRFAALDAPPELQYAAAHRNSPGKYLLELPLYLFPWTLLVAAAVRRAWRLRAWRQPAWRQRSWRQPQRQRPPAASRNRAVRFAIAASVPSLVLLSLAATARNIYAAPALPGFALLLGWWAQGIAKGASAAAVAKASAAPATDSWDVRALRATAAMLLLCVVVSAAALTLIGAEAWPGMSGRIAYVGVSTLGLLAAAVLSGLAYTCARRPLLAQWALFMSYGVLLAVPASQAYRQVDGWQNLEGVAAAIRDDARGRPLVLLAPDETTRAIIDLYASATAARIDAPIDADAVARMRSAAPGSLFVVQLAHQPLPWRARRFDAGAPPWLSSAPLRQVHSYALPNGRHYGLYELTP